MKLSFVAKKKLVLATPADYITKKRRYTGSKITIVDKKEACPWYIRLLQGYRKDLYWLWN